MTKAARIVTEIMKGNKCAVYLRDVDEYQGVAKLYRVYPGVQYEKYDYSTSTEVPRSTTFIVISAAVVPLSGPETYIFPSDDEGRVIDWYELPGSFRGELDHNKALELGGYVLIED